MRLRCAPQSARRVAAKLAAMADEASHPAAASIEALLRDCDVTRTRRSGPGGQHRNKVETAVVIEHRPTGVRAEASERRSQQRNRDAAVFRLRVALALAVRIERAGPSELWRSRCTGGRVTISASHDDFPAVLAEALDAVAMHGVDVAAAAAWLGCSTSQLVKLLKLEPRALEAVNAQRGAMGMRVLR